MPIALCPACQGAITLPGKPVVGNKVDCPHCGDKLQVVWEDPLELDWADYAEGEVLDLPPDDGAPSAG